MGTRRILIVSLLTVAVGLAGCAKRPATTAASAPPPTATASTMTPSTAPGSGAQPGGGTGMQPSQMQPGGGTGAGTATPAQPTAPPAARPQPSQFAPVAGLADVYFDFDKYDIRPGDAKILDTNAQWMKSNPNHLVLIEGHCDERGTNEYNLALGERRAKSTMNYLVSQGVQANRITIISYGEERPSCTEKNESCWSRNRRAHFLVKPR
jgi:peptidoglycan-associated lipoprotein